MSFSVDIWIADLFVAKTQDEKGDGYIGRSRTRMGCGALVPVVDGTTDHATLAELVRPALE